MAAPAGKASGTGALRPRAKKSRVRRAVRISSLVAQEVGDPQPLLPSESGARRQLLPEGMQLPARKEGFREAGQLGIPQPAVLGACWLSSLPGFPG